MLVLYEMVNIRNRVADIYQHIMWKQFSLFLVCQSVIQVHILQCSVFLRLEQSISH